jgi:tRNA threonylcarbamoyladenosine biosynthesis protein TsaB
MNILAIDTATERCSVALNLEGRLIERAVETARGHADMVLPMVEDVLREGGVALKDLEGIAYGRGPGAFTGVRIAIGVVQGLAFGARLPTVGISNLAAVARQAALQVSAPARVLVCMDARMNEVYWGIFAVAADGGITLDGEEHVGPAAAVAADGIDAAAGTGLRAYPDLMARFAGVPALPEALPHARDIAALALRAFRAGEAVPATEAKPVYLRDQVTHVKPG